MNTAIESTVHGHEFTAAGRMEHRWGHRRPCRAQVAVAGGLGLEGIGRLRDVSMSGAYLETALPLAPSSRVAIAVLRGDGTRHPERIATVVRHDHEGVGLEWLEAAEGLVCRMLGCADECPFSGPIRC